MHNALEEANELIELLDNNINNALHISYAKRDNLEIMKYVIEKKPEVIEYVSARLKNNLSIAMSVINKNGNYYRFLSLELQTNSNIAIKAIKNKLFISYLEPQLFENSDFLHQLLLYDYSKVIDLLENDYMSNKYLANIAGVIKSRNYQREIMGFSLYNKYPLLNAENYLELFSIKTGDKFILLKVNQVLATSEKCALYAAVESIDYDTGRVVIDLYFTIQDIHVGIGIYSTNYNIDDIVNEFCDGLTCEEIINVNDHSILVLTSKSKFSLYNKKFYKLLELINNK